MNIDKRWLLLAVALERCGRRGCHVAIAASAPSRLRNIATTRRISRPGKTKAAISRPTRRRRSCRRTGTRRERVELHSQGPTCSRIATHGSSTSTRERRHEENAETTAVGPHCGGCAALPRPTGSRSTRTTTSAAGNSPPTSRSPTSPATASTTGSARRSCTKAAGRSASTRTFAADAASSRPAPIPISARTPIASARCVRSTAGIPTGADRRYPDYPGRYREARATLYEGPNLSGRAFPINDAVANLGQDRLQRSRVFAARRKRLLDLLQRLRVPRRVPHVRAGGICLVCRASTT